MKHLIACLAIGASLVLALADAGFAASSPKGTTQTSQPSGAGNPSGTGQPNQSCEAKPTTPGGAASAPGSAFNPDGKAGMVYAGEQPQNSNNPKSVSQYDVACVKQQP